MRVVNIQETYPDSPLSLGDKNQHVLNLKIALNAISSNFPAIPKITPIDDTFNKSMEDAVKEFQNIYNLPVTGIVDKATWYEIRKIYAAVRNLVEVYTRGSLVSYIPTEIELNIDDIQVLPRVQLVQFFLNVLSAYYNSIPSVDIDGILGPETKASLIEFQKTMKLPTTGIIDEETWDTMYKNVFGILRALPPTAISLPALIYPNIIFQEGSEGPRVFIIQELLSYITTVVPTIPYVEPDGIFGPETMAGVIAFQRTYGLETNGIVEEKTWNKIVDVYRDLRFGEKRSPGQYPGTDIS